MSIPGYDEIIEPNDQTEARREHLEKLRELVGNVYPNKFDRSKVGGVEDTITNILHFAPIVEIVTEIKAVVATLAERERPSAELKDALNTRLRDFGNVRISGRLAVPPRVMGKAAFVHLSDGISRLQIYARRDDIKGVWNGSEPSAVAEGLTRHLIKTGTPEITLQPPATAGGSDPLAGAPNGWEIFQLLDHGDFVGVEGYLFITNTGELSVHVETLQFLAKAMVPMPDKMHGIADAEIKQRQRYVDLIGSSLQVKSEPPALAGGTNATATPLSTREVFERRAKVISSLRHFLEDHGYIEVETPMLTPKATGAAAKPFKTHHNALDIDLYARIAPELYLKRLVVGGFEKVYELNRNFRNEGISYKHNPEFTMLEFYCAYMDVNGMMDFCEELIRESVQKATGGLKVNYEGKEIDFSVFNRVPMNYAVQQSWNNTFTRSQINDDWFMNSAILRRILVFPRLMEIEVNKALNANISFGEPPDGVSEIFVSTVNRVNTEKSADVWLKSKLFQDSVPSENEAMAAGIEPVFLVLIAQDLNRTDWSDRDSMSKLVEQFFERYTEKQLGILEQKDRTIVQPTFVVEFPKSISPLSKASPENPQIAERFELFINGMEIANGFSELNDPKEQYERFVDQMSERERGDEEAMILDEDYIRALSYGMPPAAGIGIGIDRLVMLLTNRHSIRDVILFPHMRPERRDAETSGHGDAVKEEENI